MPNYGTPPLALASGSGCRVTDVDGVEYLDLLSGIAVNALGHCHPDWVAAISAQAARLGHVSNLYATEVTVSLAERLLDLAQCGSGRVFFANSGAEALEAAFKISRRSGRRRIVAAVDGFHGRTMGALALTGQPAKRDPFAPLPPDVVHVPFGDSDALQAAVDDTVAAVVLEPIQGEAGVVPAPAGYLAAARAACDQHGALLVLDEVQTGIGRTGTWFAFQQADAAVRPDVITLAKGLAGGLPMGACLAFGEAAESLGPGMHGSTFGGNPVAAAAATAVLDVIARDDLLANARERGEQLRTGVLALGHPLVESVRGRGLLLGIVLSQPAAKAVEEYLRQAGVLVNAAQPNVIRLAPPLILSATEAEQFLGVLPNALAAVS
jgi:acetylornithine aminotransferase